MTFSPILLATDLDRTLLPNGAEEESPGARERFRSLAEREEVCLVYVSGRGETLLKMAIEEFDIPVPDYAIGDVGTVIYEPQSNWKQNEKWQQEIAPDWAGFSATDIQKLLSGIAEIRLQELEKQNTFKVSYYAPEDTNRDILLKKLEEILVPKEIKASLIWSIDEAAHTGLLDVLPQSATKLHALQFLRETVLQIPEEQTVFCGDSGNDMPALTSGLQAVLVRNAREEVQQEALEKLRAQGKEHCLYIAKGDFLAMNGNYSAGVLEGIAHYLPNTRDWMEM